MSVFRSYMAGKSARDLDDAQNPISQYSPQKKAKSAADIEGMSQEALSAWDRLNQSWGQGLKVNSAYRSPEHNEHVGGAKNSQHIHGNAYDVDVSHLSEADRLDLIRAAQQSGFKGVGVYDNALHFDVGNARYWGPDYTRKSLPEWANPITGYLG